MRKVQQLLKEFALIKIENNPHIEHLGGLFSNLGEYLLKYPVHGYLAVNTREHDSRDN